MVFSVNQNRHFYVAKAYNATVTEASNEGTLGAFKVIDGTGTQNKELYFKYKGADGVLKSDRIQLGNLDHVKAISAVDMRIPLKSIEVTLDSAVNSGNPIAGEDYILRIAFRQFYGMSDQDQYFKDAAVHATSSMTPALFYQALLASLNASFSREIGATADTNPYLTFALDNDSTPTKLIITEKPQSWNLGVGSFERVYFEVIPTTVYDDGDEVFWGSTTDVTPTTKASLTIGTDAIGNSYQIADMEYFYLGERGDQYRMMGWPNYIPTKYLVEPGPTAEYYVLEIHHAFTDTGVNSYRSEKDITIVAPTKAIINSIVGAINSAASLSIATLS